MKPKPFHKRPRARFALPLLFTAIVFTILLITATIVMGISLILFQTGAVSFVSIARHAPIVPIIGMLIISTAVGTVVSFIISHFPLKPVRRMIDAINRLADGDFSVRLSLPGPAPFQELVQSFNRMAEELGGIELLRTDFVNSFSHEFKTPIVSIRGFAEELKHDDLSEEQRREYLDTIIAESGRLSSLATNVLNLSKVEKQVILSDRRTFDLTEQIRRCILLFESKWEKKRLDLSVDLEEVTFSGNEDLLSQVWLNLIDNAVKFTQPDGSIDIRLTRKDDCIRFVIRDDGCGIDDASIPRIFDKFYQGDPSRAVSGNGLGLSVALRIVELHGGKLECNSQRDAGSEFIVELPL